MLEARNSSASSAALLVALTALFHSTETFHALLGGRVDDTVHHPLVACSPARSTHLAETRSHLVRGHRAHFLAELFALLLLLGKLRLFVGGEGLLEFVLKGFALFASVIALFVSHAVPIEPAALSIHVRAAVAPAPFA
jgi:hypothetical protein